MDSLPSDNDYSTDEVLEPISHRIDQFIQIAKEKCHFPSEHNLTHDESAAIYLYTMEWDNDIFYRSSTSQAWLPYLKLFDTAVKKLPNTQVNVWRGVKEDICKKLKKDDEFIWWSNTSCSLTENVIRDSLESNDRLCFIETVNGKDISIYSHSPNHKEIILCSGARLRVVSDAPNQSSSSILHLRECSQQIENKPSRWNNSRVFFFLPQFIVLIIALLLGTLIGTTSCYQVIQVIFSWINKFDSTTIIDQPSMFYGHVDTLGNRYEGEWFDGKKHGKGKMDFANGCTYTGDWVDNMATGEGIFIWANSDRYEGQIKNGQRHGKGSYYFVNGDKYIGDWVEDKKSGDGISSLSIGKYEGQFKDDKMHGKGSFYFTDGNTYVGDWIDDKQEGEGIFTWANGDRYEGGFIAGKLHGQGSYYFQNGNKFVGEWNNGERVTDHGAFTWANTTRHSKDSKTE
jgi:hypothetical protein